MPRARQLFYESVYLVSNNTSNLDHAYKVLLQHKKMVVTKLKVTQRDLDGIKRAMKRLVKEQLEISAKVPEGAPTVDVVRIQVAGYFDRRRKDKTSLISDFIFELVDRHKWDIVPYWTYSGELDPVMKQSLRRYTNTAVLVG